MNEIHNLLDGCYEMVDLRIGDNKRRRDFQGHEIIAAYLTQDSMVPKQAHDHNLPEHPRMNFGEGIERKPEQVGVRCSELNSVKQPKTADLGHHIVFAKAPGQRLAKVFAHGSRARAELFILQYIECRKASAHGETVFAVGGSMDKGALQGAVNRIAYGVGHEHGTARNKPAAHSFCQDNHVGFDAK